MTSSSPSVSLDKSPAPPPLIPVDRYGDPLPQLLSEPRSCGIGAGITWLSAAWALFKADWLLWIAIGVVFTIITGVLGSIPYAGFIFSFTVFILIAGMMYGCEEQSRGEELKFEYLFIGFKTHLKPLLILIVLYTVGTVVAFLPSVIVAMFLLGSNSILGYEQLSVGMMVAIILPLLLCMLALMLSVWSAPALIILHDLDAFAAMKKSLKGGMANLIPILVYLLISGLLFVIFTAVTLGLGIFAFPILILSYYTSYRDIWTDQPLSVDE